MLWPRIGAALLTVPAFSALLEHPTPIVLTAVSGALAALTAISGAATFAAIGQLLPGNVRATGSAIAYAIGVSLFGGTTQVFVVWLVDVTAILQPRRGTWRARV